MFLRKSAASSGWTCLRRVMKISEDKKSMDVIKTIDKRLLSTVFTNLSHGSSKKSNEKYDAKAGEQLQLDIQGRMKNESNMPPKKLTKLANKIKNLPRSNIIEAADPDPPDLLVSEADDDPKSKLRLKNLREKSSQKENEQEKILMPQPPPKKRNLKAVVDIEMMKSELKQLEDPPITREDRILSSKRLGFEFYDVPSVTLAKNLLGKILVRKLDDGTILSGKIVETESYLGGEDRASQTYGNKITPRNVPMYMDPGTIYLYLTYGMYHCFNISCQGAGAGVLLRGISPILGTDRMASLRNSKPTANSKSRSVRSFKDHELSNGPSKFCMAFGLSREHNKHSICSWRGMWIEDNDEAEEDIKIVQCPRIGIDSAGPEWAMKPLRFYILGDKSVSKIDKKAESELKTMKIV